MKLCKDCKWMREPGPYAQCVYPLPASLDRGREFDWAYPLTGFECPKRTNKRDITSCFIQRAASWLFARMAPQGRCGKEGRWFTQLPVN